MIRTVRHLVALAAAFLATETVVLAAEEAAVAREMLPPERPRVLPAFRVPPAGERNWSPQADRGASALDEPWQYAQTLYDADPERPDLWNAVPVGMTSTPQGGVFLAVLHTIFRSTDKGLTWLNLDPAPPPQYSGQYLRLRTPYFISDIAARPVRRPQMAYDTLLLTVYNGDTTTGYVRVMRYTGGHFLWPDSVLTAPFWLTSVVVPDSLTACVFAGLDGRIYRNRTLWDGYTWELLSSDKAIIRGGRQDSVRFEQTRVRAATNVGRFVVAVGSHILLSRDGGARWTIRRASDALSGFDFAVSFCDSLRGMTGGATAPPTGGWVRVTDDGGLTWSERVLQSGVPIRAVKRLSAHKLFAAGGDYTRGTGQVWSSGDGGQTWSLDLETSAEIRELEAVRISTAFVHVIAAGFYPDFRAGIWLARVFLPDTTQAVVIAEPESLDFGIVPAGERDTVTTILRNIGAQPDTITAIGGGTGAFTALWSAEPVPLAPGQQYALPIVFRSTSAGEFAAAFRAQTVRTGEVPIFCRAVVPAGISTEALGITPEQARLRVWPNPANAVFHVRFALPRAGRAQACVYDLNGRQIATLADGELSAGEYVRTWPAGAHASGIYFVRLTHEGNRIATEKLLLVR